MEKTGIYACITNDLRSLVKIQRYCDLHGIKQYEVFIDKVDNLRDVKNRPALKDLKEKVKNKQIDFVVIDNINDISSKLKFNIDFVNFVIENDCKISDTEGVAHLNFCKTLCSAIMEDETKRRQELSRRIKVGKEMAKRYRENKIEEERER